MMTLLRLGALAALLVGAVSSCYHRRKRELLLGMVHARYPFYEGSRDKMTLKGCRMEKMGRSDIDHWRRTVNPNINREAEHVLGVCDLEFAFKDYPGDGQDARVRVTARYAWAGSKLGWQELELVQSSL